MGSSPVVGRQALNLQTLVQTPAPQQPWGVVQW